MLKRLELVGFKSFADRTQFDFIKGITAVVGPNGSGKSNIVDAVRWILGEQSAKSLRGGEMADVIFNGSASRRSLGMAEVTMTFDNTRQVLNTTTDEVQITRRVYRDGQGEYLINQAPCRLKDIKDLFLGSGAGNNAYSIIEQGRVDVLLQSSTQERRAIFEEAAGISRFKARKIETLRKLERVDLNLTRLRDIIDEVEKQLRSARLQAAKAQRYQEYSARLKELRVAISLEEYHDIAGKLTGEQTLLERLKLELDERNAQAASWDTDMQKLEAAVARLDQATREQEGLLGNARQQIATARTTLEHEGSLSTRLETELATTRGALSELNARVATLAEQSARAAAELREAELAGQEQRLGVQGLEDELQAVLQRLTELQTQRQNDHELQLEQMQRRIRLENDAIGAKARLDGLVAERHRLVQRSEQAAEHLASIDVELQELTAAEETLQARLAAARQSLTDQRQERERLRQLHDETAQMVGDLKAQRTGLTSRVEVLEGLERSHEGLGTGVREVLALREQTDAGPWRTLLGMIADVLNVRREYAPLIDLALGDWSQRFLVRDRTELAAALAARRVFSGRVSFVPLGGRHIEGNVEGSPDPRSATEDGVVAVASDLVTCENPELAGLPAQLLGRTLLVRDLAAARTLADRFPGYRLITLQGELLEPDGTLTVGTHHAETGIISRKSELRELRLQVVAVDQRIAETERALSELRDRLGETDSRLSSTQEELDALNEQASDLRSRIGQHRQRREGLHEEVTLSRRELGVIDSDITTLQTTWQEAKVQAEEAERQVKELHARLEAAEHSLRELDHRRHHQQQQTMLAKVALATVEERLSSIRAKHGQLETDLGQRRQELTDAERRLVEARERLQQSQGTMLNASAALARCYLDKESAERRVDFLARERDQQRQERQAIVERVQTARSEWQARQEEVHAHELTASELRHKRDTLIERLREDYQLDLAELYAAREAERRAELEAAAPPSDATVTGIEAISGEPEVVTTTNGDADAENPQSAIRNPQSLDPAAVNEEIAELRRKLNRLGSVNLDSLQELAELEIRAENLQTQFDDLGAAKKSLEEIIATINQDSKRLFTETFTTIRLHFQELFRKVFGGGMADILLENEEDILESGIEIVARPPGKELRSISLMSGGEKTMAAVALLLAIFRSKPSPFCILDEVDAALDEANIGRYTSVLREFLDLSQFIIITHSKRTMSCADVLYGITMQESGISKRVSVKFEDWPDDPPPAPPTATNGEGAFAGR
jgi:chromosome segregation protein